MDKEDGGALKWEKERGPSGMCTWRIAERNISSAAVKECEKYISKLLPLKANNNSGIWTLKIIYLFPRMIVYGVCPMAVFFSVLYVFVFFAHRDRVAVWISLYSVYNDNKRL